MKKFERFEGIVAPLDRAELLLDVAADIGRVRAGAEVDGDAQEVRVRVLVARRLVRLVHGLFRL